MPPSAAASPRSTSWSNYEDPTNTPGSESLSRRSAAAWAPTRIKPTPSLPSVSSRSCLSIDPATVTGIRDVAVLLVGWYGALRRSELAGLERHHLSLEEDGVVGCCAASDGGDGGGPGVEVVSGVLEAHSGALAELSQVAGVGGGVRGW